MKILLTNIAFQHELSSAFSLVYNFQ